MVIVSLQVENVKRIKAISMTPEGELVIVGGDNAQGKTSLMDAIAYLIGGKVLIPAQPIRQGAKKGFVKADLGELLVERNFWYNSKDGSLESKIVVTEKDSDVPVHRPQEVLDKLFGSLSFDPLAFSRMDRAHQLATAKDVLGLNLDLIENEITDAFELRKSLKQAFNTEDARLRNLEHYPDAPKEEINVEAVTAQAREIDAANRKREVTISEVEHEERSLATMKKELELTRKRVVELEEGVGVLATAIKEAAKKIPAEQDSSGVWEQVNEAGAVNHHVRANVAYATQEATVKEAARQLELAETALEEKRAQRIGMIEAAEFPIDGLSLDANGVIYNGFPFDQASSAEQLRVSVAMGFAINPDLKVMLIRDGSLLDAENLSLLREMAKAQSKKTGEKVQIWIERVGQDKQASVIIEDGQIKEGS